MDICMSLVTETKDEVQSYPQRSPRAEEAYHRKLTRDWWDQFRHMLLRDNSLTATHEALSNGHCCGNDMWAVVLTGEQRAVLQMYCCILPSLRLELLATCEAQLFAHRETYDPAEEHYQRELAVWRAANGKKS